MAPSSVVNDREECHVVPYFRCADDATTAFGVSTLLIFAFMNSGVAHPSLGVTRSALVTRGIMNVKREAIKWLPVSSVPRREETLI